MQKPNMQKEEKEEVEKRCYLAWKEWPVGFVVDYWWSCGWRRHRLMLALTFQRKLVARREEVHNDYPCCR
jgi:hypothetical protein